MTRSPLHLVSSILGRPRRARGAGACSARACCSSPGARCASPRSPCRSSRSSRSCGPCSASSRPASTRSSTRRASPCCPCGPPSSRAGCSPPRSPASPRSCSSGWRWPRWGRGSPQPAQRSRPPCVAAVLGVLTAVLLSRAVTSALARVMTTRVGRVLGAVVVSLVTLLPLGLNLLLATGSLAADLATFDATRSAQVASWTPVGWAWGLPFDVATGRWGTAAVHLVARGRVHRRPVGGVGAAAGALAHLAAHQLGRPADRRGAASCRPCSAPRRRPPIAARRVRAWYRDSRLVGIALRTAVLPVFFIAQAVVTGHAWASPASAS